jgi:hypothetical protein
MTAPGVRAAQAAPTTRANRPRALYGALSGLWRAIRPAAGLSRRLAARWAAVRTTALTVSGFGCLVAAAWSLSMTFGLAAAGVALLVLEVLGGPDPRP